MIEQSNRLKNAKAQAIALLEKFENGDPNISSRDSEFISLSKIYSTHKPIIEIKKQISQVTELDISSHLEANNPIITLVTLKYQQQIEETIKEEADNNAIKIGVPFPKAGVIRDFFQNLSEDKKERTGHLIRPFFKEIGLLMDALHTDTTNKIKINTASPSIKDLVVHILENHQNILDNKCEWKKFELIDISFITEIDVKKLPTNTSTQDALLSILNYVFFGIEDSEILNFQKTILEGEEFSHKTHSIKKQLERYQDVINTTQKQFKETSKKPIFISQKSLDSLLKAFLKNENQSTLTKDLCKEFQSIPIIDISPSEKGSIKNNKSQVRNINFPAPFWNRSLPKITGMPEHKQHELQMTQFFNEIAVHIRHEGIQNLKQIQELLGYENISKISHSDIIQVLLKQELIISDEILVQILSTCIDFSVTLSSKILEKIKEKSKNFELVFERFEKIRKNYNPNLEQEHSPNGKEIDILTTHENYLQSGTEVLGVETETTNILKALINKDACSIVDSSNYEDSGEFNITGRILQNIIKKIMTGECQELKNYTVLELATNDEIPNPFLALFGIVPETNKKGVEVLLEEQIRQIKLFNDKTLLVLQGESIQDPAGFSRLLEILKQNDIKFLIVGNESIPGLENIHIAPISGIDLEKKVKESLPELEKIIGFKIPKDIQEKILEDIRRQKVNGQDPLNLFIEIVTMASAAAKAKGLNTLRADVVAESLSQIFGLIDISRVDMYRKMMDQFPIVMKSFVAGQEEVIDKISLMIKNHLSGLGDPEKPLSILLPGPTGIGKTYIAEVLKEHLNMPVLFLEGSQYKEPHSVSRLTGSPPGYVGESDGVLSEFLRDNVNGIIFIDEVEKMHGDVITSLMQVIDQARITNGDGVIYRRPGMIIISASNAGAANLKPGQSKREMFDILAEAFRDPRTKESRPEIPARSTIIPMLGVHETGMKQAIDSAVKRITDRNGFSMNNMQFSKESDFHKVVDLILEDCKKLCLKHEEESLSDLPDIGFIPRRKEEVNPDKEPLYFNLREISRSIEKLTSQRLNELIDEVSTRPIDQREISIKVLNQKLEINWAE